MRLNTFFKRLPHPEATSSRAFVLVFALIAFAGILTFHLTTDLPATQHASVTPTNPSVSGNCTSQINSAHYGATLRCKGDFRFFNEAPDGTTLSANVSGQHNRINFKSSTTSGSKHRSNITISQSGTGSTASVTFTNPDTFNNPPTQWRLSN